ncbi:hypothetical protein DPMN_054478 [Dreissena polymorpha]|uniref:Uncharacterized protein n=1 Tax=Dreissena polymorpha TaxID=45954 RepID=A0A9D4CPJ4_DREPO|nr:hypothetical protein DPMN_054478 [Dreissena polymorpha]
MDLHTTCQHLNDSVTCNLLQTIAIAMALNVGFFCSLCCKTPQIGANNESVI